MGVINSTGRISSMGAINNKFPKSEHFASAGLSGDGKHHFVSSGNTSDDRKDNKNKLSGRKKKKSLHRQISFFLVIFLVITAPYRYPRARARS